MTPEPSVENDVPCPHCGKAIKAAATLCKHCKKNIPAVGTRALTERPETFSHAQVSAQFKFTLPLALGSAVALALSAKIKEIYCPVFFSKFTQSLVELPRNQAFTKLCYGGLVTAVVFALISTSRPRLRDHQPLESSPSTLFLQNRILSISCLIAAGLCLAAYYGTPKWLSYQWSSPDWYSCEDGEAPMRQLIAACCISAALLTVAAVMHWRAGTAFRLSDPEIFLPWALKNLVAISSHARIGAELQAAQAYVTTLKQNNVTAGLPEAEATVIALQEKMKAAVVPPSPENVTRLQGELAAKRQSLTVLRQNRAPEEAISAVVADIVKLRTEMAEVGRAFPGAPGDASLKAV